MIESGKIYTLKNNTKILVLGYETQVVDDVIIQLKGYYSLFCDKNYNIRTITNSLLFDLVLCPDFQSLVFRYCNYFLLVYEIEKDNFLNGIMNPDLFHLVSQRDYEEDIKQEDGKIDETEIKVWYMKNQMFYPKLCNYMTCTKIKNMFNEYTIKTKKNFEKAKAYYFRVIFDVFLKKYMINVYKTDKNLYMVNEYNLIYGVCSLKESIQQKIYVFMLAIQNSYYDCVSEEVLQKFKEKNYKEVRVFDDL